MRFYRNLARNLLILLVLGGILFLLIPNRMVQAFELYGVIIGSGAFVLLIGTAIPRQES
jgi:uncharacterized membrane protein YccC